MRRVGIVLALYLVFAGNALALVDPLEADIDEQDWMVNVLVKGSRSTIYSLFCKGSLIHPYWVLSSAGCFTDPTGILAKTVGTDKPQYAVATGNLGGFYKVEQRLISPDGTAMLLRLNRPADQSLIPLIYRAPAGLKGVQLRIFNRESSLGLADSLFNPGGELTVSCNVEGLRFFNNNRMCYVLSKIKFEHRQLMAQGQVIDPLSSSAPVHPLNELITPNTSGNRLYMDFTKRGAYPCHEDMGAPIVATQGGQLVQVGMVVAVGMATGVPFCNDSFANYLTTLDGLQDFIASAIASGEFFQQCPAQPQLNYQMLTPTRARFFWDEVHDSLGYQALFTSRLGYTPIALGDLGNLLELEVDLNPGTTYTLALQAYNADCTSVMSAQVTIEIPE